MSRLRSLSLKTVVLVLLALVLLLLPLTEDTYYMNIVITIGLHSMVTLGLCLLMGYAGQVSLGQAAFYGVGAFVSGLLSVYLGISPWLTIPIAVATAAALALPVGLLIFRLQGHYLAMATLGFGIVMFKVFEEVRAITGPEGLTGIPSLAIGGFVFNTDLRYYYLVALICMAVMLLSTNIVHSRIGRALRALHGSEAAAEASGVDVASLKVRIFILSAAYAALAGALYAHYLTFVSAQPFGITFSVQLVVMAAIGGMSSTWGAIWGTSAVTLLSQVFAGLGDIDSFVFGTALVAIMVFMPEGLYRGVGRVWREIRARAWKRVRT